MFRQAIGGVVLLVMITNTSAWDVTVQKLTQAGMLVVAGLTIYWLVSILRPRKQQRQPNSQSRRTP